MEEDTSAVKRYHVMERFPQRKPVQHFWDSQPPDPSCLPGKFVLGMAPRAVACIIPEERKCLFQSRASNDLPVLVTLSVFVNVQMNRNVNSVGRCSSCWKAHIESSKAVKGWILQGIVKLSHESSYCKVTCDLKINDLILSSVTGVPGLPPAWVWGEGIDLERTWHVNSAQGYLQCCSDFWRHFLLLSAPAKKLFKPLERITNFLLKYFHQKMLFSQASEFTHGNF